MAWCLTINADGTLTLPDAVLNLRDASHRIVVYSSKSTVGFRGYSVGETETRRRVAELVKQGPSESATQVILVSRSRIRLPARARSVLERQFGVSLPCDVKLVAVGSHFEIDLPSAGKVMGAELRKKNRLDIPAAARKVLGIDDTSFIDFSKRAGQIFCIASPGPAGYSISEGRVRLPKDIVEALGIHQGDTVWFETHENGLRLVSDREG